MTSHQTLAPEICRDETPAVTAVLDLISLLEPIKQDLEVVEEWLRTNLIDDSPFVAELLSQVFAAGGKRIRPALCLLSARATRQGQSDISRLQIILAVLTELIHTASLVHDDVIDSASLRRGKETVNRKWSDKLAVLIGDLLFAQASVCLARLQNPSIVGIYGQVLGDLCAGELRQMKQQFVSVVNWDGYIQKSIWKTASLFAAGTHSAPILSGCGDQIIACMKHYGTNLGICFQIIDDLLDVTANSQVLGKPAGSDLAQGLITAPALFVLERQDQPARRLEDLIRTRAVSTAEGIAEALDLIRANGGVELTMQLATNYASQARESLTGLPATNYRNSLESLTEWLLTRRS
jgi:all-trans-nonaprenyl-diphosphate synthase